MYDQRLISKISDFDNTQFIVRCFCTHILIVYIYTALFYTHNQLFSKCEPALKPKSESSQPMKLLQVLHPNPPSISSCLVGIKLVHSDISHFQSVVTLPGFVSRARKKKIILETVVVCYLLTTPSKKYYQ